LPRIQFNTIDTVVAVRGLPGQCAILVLAETSFMDERIGAREGTIAIFSEDADWIRVAHLTLSPLLASRRSTLFAIALLASGQSTRSPAARGSGYGGLHALADAGVVVAAHSSGSDRAAIGDRIRGDGSVNDLLVLSQVVLAMQLPFAMFRCALHSSRKRMVSSQWLAAFDGGWRRACNHASYLCYRPRSTGLRNRRRIGLT